MHVLLFDYRHFGDSDGEPRQLLSAQRQLQDYAAALNFIRNAPGVDPDRVALWVSSLAGGHVVEAAVQDGHVAAVVSQAPALRRRRPQRPLRLRWPHRRQSTASSLSGGRAVGTWWGWQWTIAKTRQCLISAISRHGSGPEPSMWGLIPTIESLAMNYCVAHADRTAAEAFAVAYSSARLRR
jgi:pimeloyl-ACP methyl ester carboxylesterase